MKSKLISHSLIFTGMTFIQKSMAFLLLPLYTRFLSPADYGVVSLVTAIYAVYILIFSLALDDAVARYYFQYQGDRAKQKVVIGTFTLLALGSSFLGLALVLLVPSIFLQPFAPQIDFYPYMVLGLVPVGCSSLYSIVQKLLIIEEKAMHYSLNTLAFFLMNTGLSIFLIVTKGLGAEGMLLSLAITYGLFFVYSLIYLLSKMSFQFNRAMAVEGLKYGGVLLPNRVASWGLTSLNKVVLGNFISPAALGIYNIAVNFSSILTIVANAFACALQPWIYRQLENSDQGQRNIQTMVGVGSRLFGLAGLTLSLFAPAVLELFIDQRYQAAKEVIPLLVWGATTSAYGILFVYILFYYQNLTKFVALSTMAGAGVNIALSFVFIPRYGIWGSALAMGMANGVICLIKSYFSLSRTKLKLRLLPMHLWALFYLAVAMLVLNTSCWLKLLVLLGAVAANVLFNRKWVQKLIKMTRDEVE